jgi:hypothetical protein
VPGEEEEEEEEEELGGEEAVRRGEKGLDPSRHSAPECPSSAHPGPCANVSYLFTSITSIFQNQP